MVHFVSCFMGIAGVDENILQQENYRCKEFNYLKILTSYASQSYCFPAQVNVCIMSSLFIYDFISQ